MQYARMGLICSGAFTGRDLRNVAVFHAWTIASALAFAGSGLLLLMNIVVSRVIAVGLIAATLASVSAAIRAYVIFVRESDELLRKIQGEGLAFAVAGTALFMVGYRLCEILGAPRATLELPLVLMLCFWQLGQWLSVRRYFGTGREV